MAADRAYNPLGHEYEAELSSNCERSDGVTSRLAVAARPVVAAAARRMNWKKMDLIVNEE